MNEHDSERIAGLLESEGYRSAESVEAADVVVLNTCCIRENADNRLYGTLGHLKSNKDAHPGMQIAVGGCLAQKDKELVQKRAPWVDVVFGTHNVGRLGELLADAREQGSAYEVLSEIDEFPSALPAKRNVPWAGWVALQVGCDNRCAFCIVPAVRGKEISRPFVDVVSEVRALVTQGVTEVTLLGQNVNSYGRDLSLSVSPDAPDVDLVGAAWAAKPRRGQSLFASLLEALGEIDGLERIRYTSPHPKDFREDTIRAMAGVPAVAEHLHLPLQSGSNRVLAAMHRGYTSERYLEKLRAAREGIADLAVTTDLIVGFPGETDEEFEETCEVVREADYDSAYVFAFSPREGTEAAEMRELFVPPSVISERFDRLQALEEDSALRRHEARVGRVEEVLVEGPSKRNEGVVSGRTRQNKLVHFAGTLSAGSLCTVEVTSAAPHFLRGDLREVLRGPKHRRRLVGSL